MTPSSILVCPRTRLPLREATVDGSRALVTADGAYAYRFDGDTPVLLLPEALRSPPTLVSEDARYGEAYDEMDYYDGLALRCAAELEQLVREEPDVDPRHATDDPIREGARLAALAPAVGAMTFPMPAESWVHLRYEGAALHDAYRHLAPLDGKRVAQIGGMGLDAVKFLLAGAREAWLVSPMAGELAFARTLAAACNVGHRMHVARAIAEELPFADCSFDAVFAAGSVHHTITELSLPECERVLAPGGRFGAVEPWRAPGYRLGTRLLGKREPVSCRPLDRERVAPFFSTFGRAEVVHHGTLTRYALVALSRLGAEVPMRVTRLITRADDYVCARMKLRGAGSSVALLATRA